MSGRRIRVFISSRMEELAAERRLLSGVLKELGMVPFVFEVDAGARPQTIRETYLEEIDAADLYIGVFWKGYGAYTIDEYEHADSLGMDCLLYEKREGIEGQRAPELSRFLQRVGNVEEGLTVRWYHDISELADFVKADVARWQAATAIEHERSEFAPLYVGVPPMPATFVGRREALKRTARRLRAGGLAALAIDGPPGVGKTTYIVGVAQHRGVLRRFVDGVLWGSLGPVPDVSGILARWAEALGVDLSDATDEAAMRDRIHDAVGLRRMLFVLDDVWQIAAARHLQCGGLNCCHLLTSRDKVLAREFAGAAATETLAVLDVEGGRELLRKLAPEIWREEPKLGTQLADAVGGLPLALALVGGSLAATPAALFPGFSDAVLEDAEELTVPAKRLKLAAQRIGNRDGPITLEDTIALSVDALPEHAVSAFHALGAFAAKPDRFSRQAAEAVAQTDARTLMLLAVRNLVEIVDADVMVHQVLMDVARTKLEASAVARHRSEYLALVEQNPRDWKRIEQAYGQIKHAWGSVSDRSAVRWLYLLQNYQRARGLWRDRSNWCERALTLAAAQGWTDDEPILCYAMGQAVTRLGRAGEGLALFQKGFALEQKGGDVKSLTTPLTLIAQAYSRTGRHDKAVESLRSALASQEKNEDWAGAATTLATLARVHYRLQQREEALRLLERAIEMARSKVPAPADAALVLEAAGSAYRMLGESEKALECLKEARDRYEEVGRRDSVGRTLWHIGLVYDRLEQPREALRYHEQAVDLAAEFGIRSDLSSALLSAGDALKTLGDDRRALEIFERMLAVEDQREGDRDVVHPLVEIGQTLGRLNRWDDGLTYFERAVAVAETTEDRRLVVQNLCSFGGRAAEFGRPGLELGLLKKSLAASEKAGNRSEVAAALRAIGTVHLALGQCEPARGAFERALSLAEAESNRVDMATTLNELGRVAHDFGRLDDALERFQSSLRINEALGRTGGIAANLNNMALVYIDQQRVDEGIALMLKALSLAEAAGDRTGTSAALANIASTYADLGSPETAIEYRRRALRVNQELAERVSEGKNWHALGDEWSERGDPQKALECYREAAAIFDELHLSVKAADVMSSVGLVHAAAGRHAEAAELYANARVIYEAHGRRDGISRMENNVGGLHWEAGRLAEAESHWRTSVAISKEIGDPYEESNTRFNLSLLYRRQHRLTEALEELERVAELDRRLFHPDLQRHRDALRELTDQLSLGEKDQQDGREPL